jgi:hypothetical protein
VARTSYRQAERVRELLTPECGARLAAALDRFLPLVERVIEQTTRRVLHGERVPAGAKVLSLFEAHTAVLRRGKARQPTEFGAKIVLDEVEGGLVTRYTICEGNADDALSLPMGSGTTSAASVGRRPCSLGTGTSTRARTAGWLPQQACGGWYFPSGDSPAGAMWPANANGGSAAATASAPGSKSGLGRVFKREL